MEGRLEICMNNNFGTICDKRFDTFDAEVACRQLGYSDTSKITALLYHININVKCIGQMLVL